MGGKYDYDRWVKVLEYKEAHPEMSNRAIGKVFGMDYNTVYEQVLRVGLAREQRRLLRNMKRPMDYAIAALRDAKP